MGCLSSAALLFFSGFFFFFQRVSHPLRCRTSYPLSSSFFCRPQLILYVSSSYYCKNEIQRRMWPQRLIRPVQRGAAIMKSPTAPLKPFKSLREKSFNLRTSCGFSFWVVTKDSTYSCVSPTRLQGLCRGKPNVQLTTDLLISPTSQWPHWTSFSHLMKTFLKVLSLI